MSVISEGGTFLRYGAMDDLLWVVPFPFINVVATALMGYKAWYA